MKMYRVHTNLSLGGGSRIRRGTLSPLSQLGKQAIDALLKSNSITQVSAPPLIALGEEWRARAERLLKADINTVEELLSADPSDVADKIGSKPRFVKQWQDEAEGAIR